MLVFSFPSGFAVSFVCNVTQCVAVFVLEYLHENIGKGALLLIASTIGTATYMNMELGVSDWGTE